MTSSADKVALLISGGVDSAVATHLLCEAGLRPDLHYIKISMGDSLPTSCTAEEDIELAQATARRYGLSLTVTDLEGEYRRQVEAYTIDRLTRGLTPNPDVMCNRLIKFGAFHEQVGCNYDFVATGHYARRIVDEQGRVWLGTAPDPVKDQTDFLAQLTPQQLARSLFPIGHLRKEEVREIALREHLPSAHRKDSQGICFLGRVNYRQYVRSLLGEREGRVIDVETGKTVGTHHGHWFHTPGQRKGLGLGGGPWFVVGKNPRRNIVYVAHGWDTPRQYGHDIHLAELHLLTPDPWDTPPEDTPIQIKTRHEDRFHPATLSLRNDGYHIHTPDPLQGIALGQFAVLYSHDARLCLGSGEITLP